MENQTLAIRPIVEKLDCVHTGTAGVQGTIGQFPPQNDSISIEF